MPFNYPLPSGEEGSWFEQVYRLIMRAHSERDTASCIRCCDTGYYLDRNTEEYSRQWLKACDCEAGQWVTLPEPSQYVPPSEPGLCLMCGNSGWVTVRSSVVQRCYSCRKTWS